MADTAGESAGIMLYVGGLDGSVTEALVQAAFIPFGDIKEINMPLDPESSEYSSAHWRA
jgi:peptidyl-prolyl isomerase E (cyclophilin E)